MDNNDKKSWRGLAIIGFTILMLLLAAFIAMQTPKDEHD